MKALSQTEAVVKGSQIWVKQAPGTVLIRDNRSWSASFTYTGSCTGDMFAYVNRELTMDTAAAANNHPPSQHGYVNWLQTSIKTIQCNLFLHFNDHFLHLPMFASDSPKVHNKSAWRVWICRHNTSQHWSLPQQSHNTSQPTDLYLNRATEPRCKFMLVKSPESVHKKIGADRSSIFRVTYGHM